LRESPSQNTRTGVVLSSARVWVVEEEEEDDEEEDGEALGVVIPSGGAL